MPRLAWLDQASGGITGLLLLVSMVETGEKSDSVIEMMINDQPSDIGLHFRVTLHKTG